MTRPCTTPGSCDPLQLSRPTDYVPLVVGLVVLAIGNAIVQATTVCPPTLAWVASGAGALVAAAIATAITGQHDPDLEGTYDAH